MNKSSDQMNLRKRPNNTLKIDIFKSQTMNNYIPRKNVSRIWIDLESFEFNGRDLSVNEKCLNFLIR